MLKEITLVLCAIIAVSHTKYVSPRDLADQVNEELEDLKNIVQGAILAAHNDLDSYLTEFTANSQVVAATAEVQLATQKSTIDGQLASIKDLAASAGADITVCTNVREELLGRLVDEYLNIMNQGISETNDKVQQILRDARYIIDVLINTVHDIEYQVRQCREDLLCLSPLLTQIQLNKIRLPQNINTELQASQTLVNLERNSVQTYSDTAVSGYTSESYSILQIIMNCADAIIG